MRSSENRHGEHHRLETCSRGGREARHDAARRSQRRRKAAQLEGLRGGTEGDPKPHNRDGDCRRNRNLDRNSFRFAARLVGPDNWFGCENADLCSTAVLRLISSKLK